MRIGSCGPSINAYDAHDNNNVLKANIPHESVIDNPAQVANILHPNVPPSRELLDGQSVNAPCYSILGCMPPASINTKADGTVFQVAQTTPQMAAQHDDSPSNQSGLSPVNLIRPLPSIVSTAPVNVKEPCSALNQWIGENPLLALISLAAVGYYAFTAKK